MPTWITDEEKQKLVSTLSAQFRGGTASPADALHAKMDLELLESQIKASQAEERAAIASEVAANASVKNARYMLWSVIAAAVSALASLGSTIISVAGHQ
ncbi:hypothetical protein [Bradyrhizobium sp.]|jgi:hypothetical protein|uniref:hypothetical protein n=1 Tax=Bradyrhizobium sp. TaxID=376 RepID=UPI003C3E9D3B